MNSIFNSNKKLLPALKRRNNSRLRKPDTTPSKAKPLDILPDLSEEDEGRPSCSSVSSSESTPPRRDIPSVAGIATLTAKFCGNDLAERKRSSRRVVLTGAEGLTFEDFFPLSSAPQRPAPAPPLYDSAPSPSLNDVDLRFSGLGISLDFPSPPSGSIDSLRRRGHSPTPSVSSSVTSQTSSSSVSSNSKKTHVTPPTSDDESHPHLLRAPTCKSHRASIIYAKSMPDLGLSLQVQAADDDEGEVDSDVEWYAHDISDVVTLTTQLPPSFPSSTSSHDIRARPDSIMPPPRQTGRSRHSKPLPSVPRLSIRSQQSQCCPSAQLDPMFPQRRKSFVIPDRPPPPPPPPVEITRCSQSSMEHATDELLAQLASAALGSGFLGTGLIAPRDRPTSSIPPSPSSAFVVTLPRPPPRMSVPSDISDLSDETPYTPSAAAELEVDITPESDTLDVCPSTPLSASIYSQPSISLNSLPQSPASAFSFEVDISGVDGSVPAEQDADPSLVSQLVPDTPTDQLYFSSERVLRSRWSSSTLGSQFDREAQTSSWIARLNLSPSKKSKGKAVPPPPAGPRWPSRSPSRSPLSPILKRSFDLERRDSTSSRMSDSRSDSGDSTASSGLKRKPIPVEMFIRT